MTELREREFEAAWAGLVFGGADSSIPVEVFEPGGKPETRTQDTDLPQQDGIRMGRDYLGGATFSLEGLVNERDAAGGWASWRQLRSAWNGDAMRAAPGAVGALRMRMPGRPTVRVYGRPRRIAPASVGHAHQGVITFVADFQAVDHRVYSDTVQSLTLTLPESDDETITPPFTPPATPQPYVDTQDTITNGGDAPAWPVVTFTGPVTNPSFWYPGRGLELAVLVDVSSGETVTVDTRPWARSVTGAGAGQARGARMVDMVLPVGQVDVAFSGHDPTATAQMEFTWRDAWTSL